MDTHAPTLIKYRFGTFEQMHNHLHVVAGRTLFFFREPRASLAGAARVAVEFSFGNSEQVSTLRGAVLSRVENEKGQTGAWLEFPDAKLAKKIDQGADAIARRHQRRLGCDLLVEVKLARMPYLCRMTDVSLGGVRVVGPAGVPQGSEVEMRIMGAEPPIPGVLGRAKVTRSDPGGDLGIAFVRADVITRVASSRLYAAVQETWAKAPEVHHSPPCCQAGHALEPPMPHMKNRT